MASSIQAYRFALKNRDAVVKLTREMTSAKDDDPRAEFVFDEVVKLNAVDTEMSIDRRKLSWMKDLFVKTETLTSPVDLDKFVDGSVREKALALAGPKG